MGSRLENVSRRLPNKTALIEKDVVVQRKAAADITRRFLGNLSACKGGVIFIKVA